MGRKGVESLLKKNILRELYSLYFRSPAVKIVEVLRFEELLTCDVGHAIFFHIKKNLYKLTVVKKIQNSVFYFSLKYSKLAFNANHQKMEREILLLYLN